MTDFLIHHWGFTEDQTPQYKPTNNPMIEANHWYHCHRDAQGITEWLSQNNVPQAAIDSLLAHDTRPMFDMLSEQDFVLILRGVNLNDNANPEDMLSLRILYYQGAIISVRRTPSKTVQSIQNQLQQGQGPQSLNRLLLAMINGLNRNIDDFLQGLEDDIEVYDSELEMSEPMMQTHKALLKMKRFIKPQQYAIADLKEAELPSLQSDSLHLRQALNTITRINETLDFYLGELEIIKGELRQYHAERMNHNTYLFSVIAAIFLPTSFLTGLLGVNVGGIPGTDSPIAFVLFCIALLGIFAIEVWILKRLRMFDKE
ncbi:zinc transporter ZntB [Vibrio sp. HB161653]